MSYETAVASMLSLGHELAQTPSHKFDLAHMRVLLEELDHPERRFPSVLIAGTNGKGSTAATLASILSASGLKTGLYTSPHLVRINERIQLNGREIDDADFSELHGNADLVAERLVARGKLPWHPSFFEMMTTIAFEHFARDKVDIAVLEVGMGGRLDATNVVHPLVSVITDISLDHQKFLGSTLSEIAGEKVGIIRPGGVVVTLPQQPEANDVIGNTIMNLGARAVNAVPYVPPVSPASARYLVRIARKEKVFRLDGKPDSNEESAEKCAEGAESSNTFYVYRYPLQVMGRQILVETPLVGRHQLRNVALAIATAEELSRQGFGGISPDAIERGIRQTRWPGRFQVISPHGWREQGSPKQGSPGQGWPELVLDVAHNPAGAWALRSALSERYEDRRLIFVFGAMRDKAISEMTEILFPLAERVIATQAENPRSASPEEIQQAAVRTGSEIEVAPNAASALERAQILAGPDDVVVITGSIYLVGEVMRLVGARI